MKHMLKNSVRGVAYILVAMLAFGCATKPKGGGPGAAIEEGNSTAPASSAPNTITVKPDAIATQNLSGPEDTILTPAEQRDLPKEMRVHFSYDSDNLDIPNQAIARAHAEYMLKYPSLRLRLEGNTDERGTRAYNLALGERRADSVKNFLIANGVPADRIEIVSFGAEKPLNPGHDETAWAENRRADFTYIRR